MLNFLNKQSQNENNLNLKRKPLEEIERKDKLKKIKEKEEKPIYIPSYSLDMTELDKAIRYVNGISYSNKNKKIESISNNKMEIEKTPFKLNINKNNFGKINNITK